MLHLISVKEKTKELYWFVRGLINLPPSLPETVRVNGCLSVSMTTQMRLMSTTFWKRLSIQNPKITTHETSLKRWQGRKRRSIIDREYSAQTSKPPQSDNLCTRLQLRCKFHTKIDHDRYLHTAWLLLNANYQPCSKTAFIKCVFIYK